MSHEVVLKSHHGSFLTAEGDKLKGHEKETEHSCWTLEHAGENNYYIKAYNGHYLTTNEHHEVHLSHDKHKHSIWTREDDQHNHKRYRDLHGHYLSLDAHHHVKTTHEKSNDQLFKEEAHSQHHKHPHEHHH